MEGVISAYNEFEAAAKLRETYSIITRIEAVREADDSALRAPKISEKTLAVLCSQLSIVLAAGLPIVNCIKLVALQQKNKDVKRMLEKVAEDIDGGYSMASSFEKNNPKLPRTFIETIRAGETSGTLTICLERLHKYYDKTSKTHGKLISSLIYPALVIFTAIIVVIIIMVVAVPMFTKTFFELGIDLPKVTRALIAVSDFFVRYWWSILMIAALLTAVYIIGRRSEAGRRFLGDFALTKAPLRKLHAMNASAAFASTMSTMLASGLPIIDCLHVTSAVISNYVFSLAVEQVKQKVEQGGSMGDTMKGINYFPKMLSEMTAIGERSGTLESTLEIIGEYFTNEVDVATTRLISLMEPIITIGLAVMTVILLLAVYLPLFSVYGGL